MLVTIWFLMFIFFWVMFSYLTHWRPTRHIGFYHYVLFYFSIYWGAIDLYINRGSTNQLFLFSVAVYPIISLFGILSGTMLSRKVNIPNVEILIETQKGKFIISLLVLFIAVYAIYLLTLGGNIPLIVSLRETNPILGHMARYAATKGYRESVYPIGFLYWFPRILIDYFGVFVIIFFYKNYRKNIASSYIKLAILGGIICLMALMDNEKYPVEKIVVITTLCIFNSRYFQLNIRSIAYLFVFGLIFIFLTGLVYSTVTSSLQKMTNMDIFDSLKYIMYDKGWRLLATRGVIGQCIPLYMIYEIIPEKYPFFMGRTFTNPHKILPYEPVALPYLIYQSYNKPIHGLKGADPTIFFGEIYANFGIFISLLSMFLFGGLLQVINGKLSNQIEKNRTAFFVAFFYLWMTYLGDFAIGFSVPWFDERIWFFIGIYILGKYI